MKHFKLYNLFEGAYDAADAIDYLSEKDIKKFKYKLPSEFDIEAKRRLKYTFFGNMDIIFYLDFFKSVYSKEIFNKINLIIQTILTYESFKVI